MNNQKKKATISKVVFGYLRNEHLFKNKKILTTDLKRIIMLSLGNCLYIAQDINDITNSVMNKLSDHDFTFYKFVNNEYKQCNKV